MSFRWPLIQLVLAVTLSFIENRRAVPEKSAVKGHSVWLNAFTKERSSQEKEARWALAVISSREKAQNFSGKVIWRASGSIFVLIRRSNATQRGILLLSRWPFRFSYPVATTYSIGRFLCCSANQRHRHTVHFRHYCCHATSVWSQRNLYQQSALNTEFQFKWFFPCPCRGSAKKTEPPSFNWRRRVSAVCACPCEKISCLELIGSILTWVNFLREQKSEWGLKFSKLGLENCPIHT